MSFSRPLKVNVSKNIAGFVFQELNEAESFQLRKIFYLLSFNIEYRLIKALKAAKYVKKCSSFKFV